MLSLPARAAEIDWKKVDAALGKAAAVSGEVHRYGLPRSDLHVTLDGIAIKPAQALGGWVAFEPMHGEAKVMGDLVLLETEITPVMSRLLDSGLEITAIHNHILLGSPATFLMHVAGHGALIRALRAGDIEVTAIRSHMLDEQPRMFFIHFWANDDAVKLAL